MASYKEEAKRYFNDIQYIINDLNDDNSKPEFRNRNMSLAITALENAQDKLQRIMDEQDV